MRLPAILLGVMFLFALAGFSFSLFAWSATFLISFARLGHPFVSLPTYPTYVSAVRGVGTDDLYTRALSTVVVDIEELNASTRTVSALVQLGAGTKLLAGLRDTSTGQLISTIEGLKPQYCGQQVTLELKGFIPAFDITVTFPLESLYNGRDRCATPSAGLLNPHDLPFKVSPQSITLPVRWDSAAYPNDTFFVNTYAWVLLPATIQLGTSGSDLLPSTVVVGLSDDEALPGLAAQVDRSSYPSDFDYSTLEVYAARTWVTPLYVHFVAAIPIALAAMLLLAILLRPPAVGLQHATQASASPVNTLPSDRPSDLLLPLSASMLTVLPLRLVLVPQDVPGLTRADFELALGLWTLLFVGIVGSWRYFMRARSTEETSTTL